jgi:hypothetical protein
VSALAVMLIAMGVADTVRRLTSAIWAPTVIAPLVVIACAALSALWHPGDIAPLIIAAAASAGWVILCARAERSGERQGAPLAVFGLASAALIMLSGWPLTSAASLRDGRRGSTWPPSAMSARPGC